MDQVTSAASPSSGVDPDRQVPCLFCSRGPVRHWNVVRGVDGSDYDLFKCDACRSAFVYPPPSAEFVDAFYRGALNSHGGSVAEADFDSFYQQVLANERAYPNSSVDAQRLVSAARRIAPGDRFLDIGAGYGFFTRAAREAGFECSALEPGRATAAVFERMNGFRPQSTIFDDAFAADKEGAFDVVLLSQVLEHIPKPADAVRNLNRILRPGGVCVIAVPHFGSYLSKIQGKRDMFIVPPEHLNFFSKEGLRALFEQQGFDQAEVYTVSRYDRNALRRKLKVRPVADAAYALLDLFLKTSDARGRGTFINALFVKKGAA